jgi:hypothetical protein
MADRRHAQTSHAAPKSHYQFMAYIKTFIHDTSIKAGFEYGDIMFLWSVYNRLLKYAVS